MKNAIITSKDIRKSLCDVVKNKFDYFYELNIFEWLTTEFGSENKITNIDLLIEDCKKLDIKSLSFIYSNMDRSILERCSKQMKEFDIRAHFLEKQNLYFLK